MLNDGPKRGGRFLKKGSKVMERVVLQDFAFQEINATETITHDNEIRTIIHAKYHDDAELSRTVRIAAKLDENLVTPQGNRPVIWPIDFTQDWERDKKMRKDRISLNDDDEFDFEATSRAAAPVAAPRVPVAAVPFEVAPAPVQAAATVARPAATRAPEGRGPNEVQRSQSMDVVGKAINSLLGPEDLVSGPPSSGFIPVAPTAAHQDIPSNQASADLEREAMERYKLQLSAAKEHEDRMARELDEAKARGYREGFRIGEEKAEMQARRNAGEMFGKVAELIHEFQGLKHEILGNVQENFYELCQAMAESLIQREFSLHPDTFVAVLRRAISEAVDPGVVKIKVHPDMYAKIAALGANEILPQLVRDPQMPEGDFRIESELSVVDVSIKKMIGDLLNQADLDLFAHTSGASESEKKAG